MFANVCVLRVCVCVCARACVCVCVFKDWQEELTGLFFV